MSEKSLVLKNNQVTIKGKIQSNFIVSHEVFGESFYMTDICVNRLSENCDCIPLIVSERLVDVNRDYTGSFVCIKGQFRSFNHHEGEKGHLVLNVFVREWEFMDEIPLHTNCNQVSLYGYICKPPVYRVTPKGREIADLLVAVNRPYGKSDYIPCICWGRNAQYVSEMEVGTGVQFSGRIQSREYVKKIDEGQEETRVAYELSVASVTQPNYQKENSISE